MKIQNKILFIGIVCIFLGTLGIVWGIIGLLMPQIAEFTDLSIPEIPSSLQSWRVILNYTNILVNAIYLTAGILFLLKKKFSFEIIYFALTINIMYQIIPMLFLNHYSTQPYFHRYEFNFFNLIGPIFNTVLLLIVYRIRKDYNKSPEEYIEFTKEKTNKINFLISGYILLILSSAFLDVDLIALVAMPSFLLSVVLILIFYLALISKENPKRKLTISLIISGTIIYSAVAGFIGIRFIECLRDNSGSISEEFISSYWPFIGVYICASIMTLIGIRQSRILDKRKLFLLWLPTLGILPMEMMTIMLLKLDQFGI